MLLMINAVFDSIADILYCLYVRHLASELYIEEVVDVVDQL
jgi:hypothetical protein